MEGLKIKWSGKEYDLFEAGVTPDTTVQDLQQILYSLTNVLPEHQKIFGIKYKNVTDTLQSLKIKPKAKLMLMGSIQKDIAKIELGKPEGTPEVIDDFDDDLVDVIKISNNDIYLNKIDRRIGSYPVSIFNKPRENAKLLVLDIDYTLFDHLSVGETALDLQRPYLHEFLTRAYTRGYDIIIWSATNMKWIEAKMKLMGVDTNENYKIVCYLDSLAMIEVYLEDKGLKRVKPLGVIWGKGEIQGNDKIDWRYSHLHQSSSKSNQESENNQDNSRSNIQSNSEIVSYLDQSNEQVSSSFTKYMKPNNYEKANKSGPNFAYYYNKANTIMFDDVKRNFIMNPQNGLRIKPFREAHKNRDTDIELARLADYLEAIWDEKDFSELDMDNWKGYLRKKERKRE